jgi:hypothetical protein
MDDMSLDRRAYTGPPKIRKSVWPDELNPYVKINWLWDEEEAAKSKPKRQPSKAAILKKNFLDTI